MTRGMFNTALGRLGVNPDNYKPAAHRHRNADAYYAAYVMGGRHKDVKNQIFVQFRDGDGNLWIYAPVAGADSDYDCATPDGWAYPFTPLTSSTSPTNDTISHRAAKVAAMQQAGIVKGRGRGNCPAGKRHPRRGVGGSAAGRL